MDARVRPPLWISAADPLNTRFFVFHPSILRNCRYPRRRQKWALPSPRRFAASAICYASVTSSLSSPALGKKDTLSCHFFRINWWKEELNKAKHGGVCRRWPAAPSIFLSIFLGSSLMITEYTLCGRIKLFLILISTENRRLKFLLLRFDRICIETHSHYLNILMYLYRKYLFYTNKKIFIFMILLCLKNAV